jgi:hypothetical protein
MERIERKVDAVRMRLTLNSRYKPLPPQLLRRLKWLAAGTLLILLLGLASPVVSSANGNLVTIQGQQVQVATQQANNLQEEATALSVQAVQFEQEGNAKQASSATKQSGDAEESALNAVTAEGSEYNRWLRNSTPGTIDEIVQFGPLAAVSLASVVLGGIISYAILRFIEMGRFVEEEE